MPPLNEQDNKVIQEIVDAAGQCLNSKRCPSCPFRGICLPEFLNEGLSPESRLALALKVMANQFLLGEDISAEDIKRDYSFIDKK